MFNKSEIDQIITENWNKIKHSQIAEILTQKGLKTNRGFNWTDANVSNYALRNLELDRITSKCTSKRAVHVDFKKSQVESFIISNIKNKKQEEIAKLLNEQNLLNPFNNLWCQVSLSKYILEHLPEYRKKAKHTKNRNQENVFTPEVKAEIVNDNFETEKKELTVEQGLILIEKSISQKDGKFFTDSLAIAKIFEKNHQHVLEAIKNCECSDKFRSVEFSTDVYYDIYNRQMPKFNLTKKGFSFVAMGFTGSKAAQFKEAYIEKFEELENQVKQNIQEPQQLITDPLTILSLSINELKKTNDRVNQVEKEFSEFKVNVKQAIQSEIKEANKGIEANLEKINKFNDRKIRLAENRLKQTALDLQIEELPNYYDKTKKIVIDYTVVNGLKEEDAGINYDKLYSAMERKFQIPFRQNLEAINQQYPKNKQISKIKYFQQIGLEKLLFDTACELFVGK
jgi:Rha family phage regulatory protein